MFHPFLTVQAGAPRHCLSIALALVAIKCETFTSNITNYYYTRPPFRCAARACADAVRPAALHCSMLCISELCLRPNPCGIECTDCTAQYTLPAMGGSIEPPEPPLATGLELVLYCLRAVLLLGSGLILYCLRAVLLFLSGIIQYCLRVVLLSAFALWISLILLTRGSLFGLWMTTILHTSGSPFGLWFSLILFTSVFLYRL